jgi:predicted nuclease of restriction endonuclease-like (RecB) superfamily
MMAIQVGRSRWSSGVSEAVMKGQPSELETFLLEMGSGFSFVARQKRIQLDGEDFYIDLLFYNRKLKRLIVVELKQGSFKPE